MFLEESIFLAASKYFLLFLCHCIISSYCVVLTVLPPTKSMSGNTVLGLLEAAFVFSLTTNPIERVVPSTMRIAVSTSAAFKSGALIQQFL